MKNIILFQLIQLFRKSIMEKLVLVKCITLLFLESKDKSCTENSSDLVKKVLETIKITENSVPTEYERELINSLKETAHYFAFCDSTIEHDAIDFKQRLKIVCNNDETLYDSIVDVVDRPYEESEIKSTVLSIRTFIRNYIKTHNIIASIQAMATNMRFKRDAIGDVSDYVNKEIAKLEKYLVKSADKDPNLVNEAGNNDSDIEAIFDVLKESENSSYRFKCGFQGVNNALQGGPQRGDFVIVNALQHRYKTGFTLSLFAEYCRLNKPVLKDPNKKPLMLRISFEDSLHNNFKFLFKYFWMSEHGVDPNLRDYTSKQMSSYVFSKLRETGYHVQFMRVNPSGWTYKDIENTIIKYEAMGYEVHFLALDYLKLISTEGTNEDNSSMAVQSLFRRVRNFCSARDITAMTPHQLSSEAKNLIRDGCVDFVKQVAGKGYTQACKSIDNEVDIECYIHIEKMNGQAYLTFLKEKHRGADAMPDEDKYVVYAFPKTGPIPSDYGKAPAHGKKVGFLKEAEEESMEYAF